MSIFSIDPILQHVSLDTDIAFLLNQIIKRLKRNGSKRNRDCSMRIAPAYT